MIGKSANWPGTLRGEAWKIEYEDQQDRVVLFHRTTSPCPCSSCFSWSRGPAIPMQALHSLLGSGFYAAAGEIAVKISPELLEKLLLGELELPACKLRYERESREVWVTAT